MRKTISVFIGIGVFYALVAGVTYALLQTVTDISDPAPDALHLISFIALLPMIGLVGDRFADRKIAYIKKMSFFKPAIVGIFLTTYLSFVPWILTFIVSNNRTILFADWSIVLVNIAVSFVIFLLFLIAFLRD